MHIARNFSGFTVPVAGLITSVWLTLGGILFLFLFGDRARVVDAAAEATDPQLVRLRGRSPLVLVPIANPANAAAMVGVANALTPPGVGRVLLLSVVATPESWRAGESPPQLLDAEAVLRESLIASFSAGLSPEALITVAPLPWSEIGRVSRVHRCESLLLGFSDLAEEFMGTHLEELISSVDCDVSILRARPGWDLSQVRRVLVPIGGHGTHDQLRARFLGSLCRTGGRDVSFLRVLPERVTQKERNRAKRELDRLARDKVSGHSQVEVILSNEIANELSLRAAKSDLIILGLQRFGRRNKGFGEVSVDVARNTDCAVVMISQQG